MKTRQQELPAAILEARVNLKEALGKVNLCNNNLSSALSANKAVYGREPSSQESKIYNNSLRKATIARGQAERLYRKLNEELASSPQKIEEAELEVSIKEEALQYAKDKFAKVTSEDGWPNKEMLLAFLDGDRAAFKKHFAAFEKFMCNQSPYDYVQGLGDADELYKTLEVKLKLAPEDISFLVCKNNDAAPSFYLSFLESSKQAAQEHLDGANGFDCLSTDNLPRKLDAFISKAKDMKKDKLIASLPDLKAQVKTAKINNNKSVLQSIKGNFRYYGEGKYSILYARDAIAYAKSWCQSFFMGLKDQSGKVGEALGLAQGKLKEAQDDLKHIRQAAGFFSGFTYTSELKEVLQKKPKDDSNMKTEIDGNMKTAIETKETKLTLKTRMANWFGFKPAKDKAEVDAAHGSGSSAANSADFEPGDGEVPPGTSLGGGSNRPSSAPANQQDLRVPKPAELS